MTERVVGARAFRSRSRRRRRFDTQIGSLVEPPRRESCSNASTEDSSKAEGTEREAPRHAASSAAATIAAAAPERARVCGTRA